MTVMPDHVHGVILIGTEPGVLQLPKLGDVVGDFKGRTTSRYIKQVKAGAWAPFRDRVWQGRYIDRIVRDDKELDHIPEYIETNPYRWEQRKNGTDV